MTRENEIMNETAQRELVITRVFDAPREWAFKAFTESERLAHWWGPKGFAIRVAKVDLRPGGLFHYCLQSPGGGEMWGRFQYHEILAPERIVYISSFSDAEGGITRAPFSTAWPLEILNTVTCLEQEGKTTFTLLGRPVNATAEEHITFENGLASVQQGFAGTLDQLADYLKQA